MRFIFRYLCVFMLFVCFATNLSGQAIQQNVDSLKILLETNLHDSSRLNVLYELTNEFSKSDLDQGILYGKQLFKLSETTNNDIKLTQAYTLLSMFYFQKQNPLDSILQFAQEGLEVADRTEDLGLQNNLRSNIALILERSGQYKEAFVLFQEIINTSLDAGLKVQAMKVLSNAALIPLYKKDYETANIYYFRALEIAREVEQVEFEAVIINNIAEVYRELNLLDSALIYFNESVAINRKLDQKARVSYTLANIGTTYGKLKKYGLANTYFKESYDLAKANNFNRMLAINRAYYIEVLHAQKKYQQSHRQYHNLSHLISIFRLAEQVDIEDRRAFEVAVWFHDIIYQPYFKNNEARSADFFKKMLKMRGVCTVDHVINWAIVGCLIYLLNSAEQGFTSW